MPACVLRPRQRVSGYRHTFAHMFLEPSVRKTISFADYESGHAVCLDQKKNDKLRKRVGGS